ncbi:MAG: DMT family transporter [Neomegalonema sp.]|nr:DMT family transporter [Neomegalonema sp.]
MGEFIVSIAHTPAGEALALALALLSALAHALFGAINKGGADPFLNRGAINIAYGAMALPLALFVFPLPSPALWAALGATYLVHIVYEWFQAASFHRGAFTLVYPIARGTSPVATVAVALVLFNERLTLIQWLGLLLLSLSIYAFALANLRDRADGAPARAALISAILTALGTGVMIAVYTNVDAYGIRLADDPFTFLAWFYVLGGVGFPIIAAHRWRRMPSAMRPPVKDLAIRGFFGAIIAFISFGALMLATRLDKIGEAAALRETSIIFGAAIGVLIFKEKIDGLRIALIIAIAAGAVLIELG